MTPLAIVQIGDIHYPDIESETFAVDQKDYAVSPLLVSLARPDRMRNCVKGLLKVLDERRDDIKGLLICGDLTSRGQLAGYETCLKQLNNWLQLSDTTRWTSDQIHAVPGNHDVDRAACDPSGSNLFQKFIPLEDAWKAIGVPILSTRDARRTALTSGPHSVSVLSLNSCIGCGERRSLPALIQQQLEALLKPHFSDRGKSAFELVGETLDTPAFTDDHVTDVVSAIASLPAETLPLVLAHHNLLPQALVRVEIYTEVINGGLVRSRLTEARRPIIYCHGHIHRDPIEVISDASQPGGRVVSIAAPKLLDGFNVIEIHFSRSNTPIGCKVHRYRTSHEHGGLTTLPSVRVPLQDALHARHYQDELTKAAADCVTKDFATLEIFRKSVTAARNGTAPQYETLAQAIEDLHWLGLVEIHNHEEESRSWQVRRIQP